MECEQQQVHDSEETHQHGGFELEVLKMKQISTFLSLLFSFLLLLGATGIASAKVDVLAHVDKDITVKENFS
ncbi:MAG: hypothetical protein WAO55_15235 [Candidatus Manganitrophaceae bacterium]